MLGLVLVITLMAVVVVCLCVDGVLAGGLFLAIVTLAVYILGRYVFLSHSKSVRKIVWHGDAVQIVLLSDLVLDVAPSPYSVLGPGYTLLCFRICGSGGHLSVPIFSDGADSESLRRLRARLRCGASSNSQLTQG